jgi:SAM-dependent methyltransferase
MPTHQSLGGTSDEQLLQRMISTHPDRYGPPFWDLFFKHVAPALPPSPVVIDLGCGPGLLLRDLGERFPTATLYGYDVTPAMIAHARQLTFRGPKAAFAVHDVATAPLPHDTGSMHLVSMSSVLHVLDEPLPLLSEILRVLAPSGTFLLNDWFRQPLSAYIAYRRQTLGEGEAETRRAFRLFPVHNKYTPDDWRWLLAEAGFAIRHEAQIRDSHLIFVCQPLANSAMTRG